MEKREQMYELEFNFISRFIDRCSVLDVGCGGGDFLQLFKDHGYLVEGVEYGEEAALVTSDKGIKCYQGELPQLFFEKKYDLIILRGTIQYFPSPVDYLTKCVNLLSEGGMIYINYINTGSFCFNLYGNLFNNSVTSADNVGFNGKILDEFFTNSHMKLLAERDYYLETPYANPIEDIIKVYERISGYNNESPPFWGNMMGAIWLK